MTRRPLDLPIHALELPEGFALPDWEAPLETAPYFRDVPADGTAKGMFVLALQREARRLGKDLDLDKRYYAFHDYPLDECMELMLKGARTLYPDETLRSGIRRISWLAYSTFADSMIGRVIFGVLGDNVTSVLSLTSKGFSRATNVGKVEPLEIKDGSATLHFSDIHVFAEVFAAAVLEGLIATLGRRGVVAQRMISRTEGDLYVEWE